MTLLTASEAHYGVLPQARPADGLLRDVDLLTGTWSATLAVDSDDPYFFDHPLDHLPGMALVCGLLDLLRATGTGHPERPGHRMRMSLDLPAFCELETPVHLEASRLPSDDTTGLSGTTRVVMRARQGGQIVCGAEAAFRPATLLDTPGAPVWARHSASARRSEPARPELVHRHRPENVLIGGMAPHGATRIAEVRRPPEGHPLAPAPGAPPRAELIIDAARQFGTMICHVEHAVPEDARLILLAVEADLPCELPWDLRLGWTRTAPRRGRSRMRIEVLAGDADAEPCGAVTLDYYAASPAIYRRLRHAGRTA
ncbi:AfsA-related hotdog domain-containing protein [Planobispora siamensis]|uniref:A-factor biosynthesis hotdog domain-containing protein n=1 Tax=Planobispora siamensis TaxID=936338 RepID=A0A8J3SQU1_9ACTN|nr:AfsA-related hotdog domain-containing protein [Planobispora siamensis]GIH97212.1 hypothetical protein Psi01_78420 [Planobispora siamensis]